ncbi:MAG: hypothetical protein HY292_03180 [Planctomycetes bacterium]|nr:hypothetical protein [Planctomycetota bacterium]
MSDDNRWLYTLSSNNVVGVIDIWNGRFVRGIDLNGLAINPSGVVFCHGKLYIESYSNICVVDPSANDRVTTIFQNAVIGQTGGDVATAGDCGAVYCIAGATDSLTIIDPNPNGNPVVVDSVFVGRNNTDLSLTTDGTRGYVVNAQTATITVVDLVAHKVIGSSNLTGGRPFLNLPMDSAVRSDGVVYVSWVSPDYLGHVSVLDSDGNLTRVLNLPGYSTGLGFSTDERMLFAGGGWVIDSNDGSVIAQIPTVSGISAVTFSPDGEHSFLTNTNQLYVTAVDGFTPALTAPLTAQSGETITFDLVAPNQAGQLVQLAGAYNAAIPFGNGLGQTLTEGLVFPLDADPLFNFTLNPNQTDSVNGFAAHFGSDGRATATIRLANLPGGPLRHGDTLYFAFGTFTGEHRSIMNVERISNVVAVTIR